MGAERPTRPENRELAQRTEQKRRLIWTGTYAKVTTV
jgi:hypothetical protein